MEEKRLLLIVDPQEDFVRGSLPVGDASEAMKKLAKYIEENKQNYVAIACTLDWHPSNHSSFAEFGGQWPSHCVQHTHGACISEQFLGPELNKIENKFFLTKGDDATTEEYSVFANDASKKKLCTFITKEKITQIDICGIAGDVCVLNTLKDGINLLGVSKFNVLTEFCASLDGGKTLHEFIIENNIAHV